MNKVKSFEEFINESIWSDLQDRSSGDVIKKENGMVIGETEDGQRIVIGNDAYADGKIVQFDGEKILKFGENLYVVVVSDGETDVFYAFDSDKDVEDGDGNMTRCFEMDSSVRLEHDLKPLRAIIQSIDTNDTWDDDYFFDFEVTVRNEFIIFEPSKWMSYRLFFNHDDAVEYAIERESDNIGSYGITKEDIERWQGLFGNEFFDVDWFKEVLQESWESYYDDLNEEDAIDELLRQEVIEDTEEYFSLDEDGEIDHHQPLFDYVDYKDKYVEKRMDEIEDPVEEYISQYGTDGLENHTDFDKLAKLCVNYDGPGNTIATYDGVEREEEIDGTTYYIYRED